MCLAISGLQQQVGATANALALSWTLFFPSNLEPYKLCHEFQLWQEVPLLTQLLMSRSEESQEAERAWLLQLLVAGMQGPLDGDVCRYARAMPYIRIEKTFNTLLGQVQCQGSALKDVQNLLWARSPETETEAVV